MHYFWLFVLSVSSSMLFCQTQAELEGQWFNTRLSNISNVGIDYNEVWGAKINEVEYAFIGSTEGVHVIDITDTPTEKLTLPGNFTGNSVIHRDFKTYQNYLYLVGDQGAASLQIFDLSNLPESAPEVYNSDSLTMRAHNLFIDSTNQVLYIIGENGRASQKVAAILLDISDPINPTYLSEIGINNMVFDGHDAYVRDGILFLNAGLEGLYIYDCTNPSTPILLSQLNNYEQQGYNHSGWLSDDGNTYYMADENFGLDCKVIDVSDLSEPKLVSTFHAQIRDEFTIPHNLVIKDSKLYTSYYFDGYQLFDISAPSQPKLESFYISTKKERTQDLGGAWGIYPLLPSGRVLLSDAQEGLFIFEAPSSLTSTSNAPATKTIELYPNPTTDFLYLDPTIEINSYEIFDVMGRSIAKNKVETNQIDVQKIPPGYYFFKVWNQKDIFAAPFIKK